MTPGAADTSRLSWARRARQQAIELSPGLAAVALLALLATWLSDIVGVRLLGFEKSPVSPITAAVVLGLLVGNLLTLPAWLKPGLGFTVKRILRLGIILLGIRLSFVDVARLGLAGIPIVLVCVAAALLVTTWVNRRLDLPRRLGTLIAVGTSICGISAVVATAPAIGADEEETAYAVTTITVFGVLALVAYPYAAYVLFGLDPAAAGLFLGTAIHDTSQVTGAALAYAQMFDAPRTLDVATVTKLVRNLTMVLVIPLMTYLYARSAARAEVGEAPGARPRLGSLVPWFVGGFVLMAVARSLGDAGVAGESGRPFGLLAETTWASTVSFLSARAGDLLLLALCGVGLTADLRSMRRLGLRPLGVGLGAAVTVGFVGYVAIRAFGGSLL